MSSKLVPRADDLKSALVLSGAFAVVAAAAVPFLLPALPAEARTLPLPLPAFCALLGVQLLAVYGALAFLGMRFARGRGLDPTAYLSRLWNPRAARPRWSSAATAFVQGIGCGTLLLLAVAGIKWMFPGTLPPILHPPGVPAALLASLAASLGEEILFRLFVLSAVLRLLPPMQMSTVLAVGGSALAFGGAHAPGLVFSFGGWDHVPLAAWIWIVVLNGLLGVAFGASYLRGGIVCAILAHFGTDLVWHVASQAMS